MRRTTLNIELENDDAGTPTDAIFRPGELITGHLTWKDLPKQDERLEIRFIWFTTGKGDRDFRIVDQVAANIEPSNHRVDFRFTAPHRPLSFSGALIALEFAIEVVTFPSKASHRRTLVISTDGQPIALTKVDEDTLKASLPVSSYRFTSVR